MWISREEYIDLKSCRALAEAQRKLLGSHILLTDKEYQEYLEYKKQADKETLGWDKGCTLSKDALDNYDNCHCTCGEVSYDPWDEEEDIETLFDITDDLQGEIRFNQRIQRLVNKTFREEIQEIKDELAKLLAGTFGTRANKGTNKKKTTK